jgi:hypothetical protein
MVKPTISLQLLLFMKISSHKKRPKPEDGKIMKVLLLSSIIILPPNQLFVFWISFDFFSSYKSSILKVADYFIFLLLSTTSPASWRGSSKEKFILSHQVSGIRLI